MLNEIPTVLSYLKKDDLPTGWDLKPVGELLLSSQYGLNNPSDPDGNAEIIGMKDIKDGKLTLERLARTTVSLSELKTYRLRAGDLLINRTNSLDQVGKVGIVEADSDVVFASYLVRLVCDRSKIEPRFLNAWLNSSLAQRTIKRIATPAIGQANLNPTEFQRYCLVPFAPLIEQGRIAELLRSWDEAIDTTERLAAAKERNFKRLREQLAWDKSPFVALEQVLVRSVERVGAGKDLRVFSVTKDGLILQSEHFKKRIANDDISRHMLVTHGDFVLSGLNFWLGSVDVSLDPNPFCISPDYKVFKLTGDVQPRFFRQLIRTERFRHILASVAVERASVVRKNFDRATFVQNEIPMPKSNRQHLISEALESAEREVALEVARRDELIRQKRGLMQKLLTGEWRVPSRDCEVDDLAERAATGEAA